MATTYFKGSLKTDSLEITQEQVVFTEVSATLVESTNVFIDTSLTVTSGEVTATGNNTTQSATATALFGKVTTGALTTAANAVTDLVVTLPDVAATNLIFAEISGGTNTTPAYISKVIPGSGSFTVKLQNGVNATTALNGTVVVSYFVVAA